MHPYKIQFKNLSDTIVPVNSIFASLEVIDQNKLIFIGKEVVYTNGKTEKPESKEQNIILSRVIVSK